MGLPVIVAVGKYLPEAILDNSFFAGRDYKVYLGEDAMGRPIFEEELVFLDEAKILKNTGGIRERRRAASHETIDSFVERAFLTTGFDAKELTGILVATISDQMRYPSVACRTQDRIGASNVCYTADICSACSGFTHALDYAGLKVAKEGGVFLVAGAEILTRDVDYEEVNCDLFGDGCGVAIVARGADNSRGILATRFGSDTTGLRYIYRDSQGKLRMPEGAAVFKKASRGMIDSAHAVMEKANISKNEISLYIPHQANGRIIDVVEKDVDPQRTGKIFRNLDRYGNMSAATVPIALAEAVETGKIKEGDNVILVDFGSGLSLGGALFKL